MTTETATERAKALHDQLKPDAGEAYWEYILMRTPADLQDEMATIIESDLFGSVTAIRST